METEYPKASELIDVACELLGVEWEQVKSSSRSKALNNARELIAIALRNTGLSYPEISAIFGRKNHSSVHQWCINTRERDGRDVADFLQDLHIKVFRQRNRTKRDEEQDAIYVVPVKQKPKTIDNWGTSPSDFSTQGQRT